MLLCEVAPVAPTAAREDRHMPTVGVLASVFYMRPFADLVELVDKLARVAGTD